MIGAAVLGLIVGLVWCLPQTLGHHCSFADCPSSDKVAPPPTQRVRNHRYKYAAFSGTPEVDGADVPPDFKVAYLADTGLDPFEPNSGKVLELVKRQNANMVLHSGDFDYHDSPRRFEAQINRYLGPDFPFFFAPGNHDKLFFAIEGYQDLLIERVRRTGANCTGEAGVHTLCSYRGFAFLLSGFHLKGYPNDFHEPYIEQFLNDVASAPKPPVWMACVWHRAPGQLQMGFAHERIGLFNSGFYAFDLCRAHGAMIFTSHTHIYTRTFVMSDFARQTVVSRDMPAVFRPRQSIHVVMWSLMDLHFPSHDRYFDQKKKITESRLPRFLAFASCADLGLKFGALFCTYNVDGRIGRGRCEYVDIDDRVIDSFTILSRPNVEEFHFSALSYFQCNTTNGTIPYGVRMCCVIHPRDDKGVPSAALPEQIRVSVDVFVGSTDSIRVSALHSTDWGESYTLCLEAPDAVVGRLSITSLTDKKSISHRRSTMDSPADEPYVQFEFAPLVGAEPLSKNRTIRSSRFEGIPLLTFDEHLSHAQGLPISYEGYQSALAATSVLKPKDRAVFLPQESTRTHFFANPRLQFIPAPVVINDSPIGPAHFTAPPVETTRPEEPKPPVPRPEEKAQPQPIVPIPPVSTDSFPLKPKAASSQLSLVRESFPKPSLLSGSSRPVATPEIAPSFSSVRRFNQQSLHITLFTIVIILWILNARTRRFA